MAPERVLSDEHIAAVVALARAGIPPDIQELLVFGNPMRGIPPGALDAAISAAKLASHPTEAGRALEQSNDEVGRT